MIKNKSIYILRRKQQVNILAMPQMSNRLYMRAFAENFLMGVCVCLCVCVHALYLVEIKESWIKKRERKNGHMAISNFAINR